MIHNPRLYAFGYWGKVGRALSFAARVEDLAKSAKRRPGAYKNVRLLGIDRDGSPSASSAIILRYRHVFTSAYNLKANWITDVGSTNYLENPGLSFRGGIPSLFYALGTDAASKHHGFSILANQPFVIRFRIPKPPDANTRPLFLLRWGRYQLELQNGSLEARRMAESSTTQTGWDQTSEDAMNTLLAQATISSADQSTIDTYRANLYKDINSVSFQSVSGEAWYDGVHTLTFIPEPAGKLHIIYGGPDSNDAVVLDNTDVIATRTSGNLWPTTNLYVSANCGAYEWQVGTLNFYSPGEIRFGEFRTAALGGGSLIYSYNADSSTGGTVTVSSTSVGGVSEIYAQLTNAGGGVFTPFLYSAAALVSATDRDGDTATAFDSDDYQSNSTSPIMEVRPNFDGINRRAQFEVELRCLDGSTLADMLSNHEILEQRMATLSIDGANFVTNGVIYGGTYQRLAGADAAASRADLEKNETTASLTLLDQWAILEEFLIRDAVPGDGRTLGAYLKIILNLVGIKSAEMTGISDSYGITLPSAAVGEDFAIYPSYETSAADFIRELLDVYGFGCLFYQHPTTGVWTLTDAPTTTAVITYSGTPRTMNFSSSAATNSSSTYPGRLAILEQLDAPRDISDFYNSFVVEGGPGPDGLPIQRWWTINSSITVVGATPATTYIGREKRARTFKNTAWRTESMVESALRSLRIRYGMPPRYLNFRTYYHNGLLPGHIITADGTSNKYRIERISDGSVRDDSSIILAREWVAI